MMMGLTDDDGIQNKGYNLSSRGPIEKYMYLGGVRTIVEVPLRRWEIRWRRALGGSPAAGRRDSRTVKSKPLATIEGSCVGQPEWKLTRLNCPGAELWLE